MDPILKPMVVGLEEIEKDLNGAFSMSYAFPIGNLLYSLRSAGLVNPPILLGTRGGRFQIVCGLRRVIACEVLGLRSIRALVTEGVGEDSLILMGLYENLGTRAFNMIEKAMAAIRLSRYLGEERAASLMPLLGMQESVATIEFSKWLLDELSDEYKIIIANNKVSHKVLLALSKEDNEDTRLLLDLIIKLQLGKNYQNELFAILKDLSIGQGKSLGGLITESGIIDVLESNRNPSQKARVVMDILRELRFPRIGMCKKAMEDLIKSMRLKDGITIETSNSLENNEYLLKIRFRNGIELREKLDLLISRPLSSIPDMNGLFLETIKGA